MKTKRTVVKHFDKGPVVKYTYDNGAVYLYHSYPGISRVCFSVTFIVGSINEKDNEASVFIDRIKGTIAFYATEKISRDTPRRLCSKIKKPKVEKIPTKF